MPQLCLSSAHAAMEALKEHARKVEVVLGGSNIEGLILEANTTPRPVADANVYRQTYGQCIAVSESNVKRMAAASGVFCALSGENNGYLPELCQLVVAALLACDRIEAGSVPHTLRLIQSMHPSLQLLVVYLYIGAVPSVGARVRELGPQTKPAFDQLRDITQYVGQLQSHLFLHPHGIGLLTWLSQCIAFVWSDSIALK